MTVSELIKELKQYPKDTKVLAITDWEALDEDGRFTECKEFESTAYQIWYDDTGFSKDYAEVLIY
jgi:hypothetical protein